MPEGENIHPDDQLVEWRNFLEQARELVEKRFPDLMSEEKEQKIHEVATAMQNYTRARVNYDISKWERDD